MTSTFGFEPAVNTDPSGRRVAAEWYIRGTTDEGKLLSQRWPVGAEGSYTAGRRTGSVAYCERDAHDQLKQDRVGSLKKAHALVQRPSIPAIARRTLPDSIEDQNLAIREEDHVAHPTVLRQVVQVNPGRVRVLWVD